MKCSRREFVSGASAFALGARRLFAAPPGWKPPKKPNLVLGVIGNIERQQRWVPTRNTVQKDNFRTRAGKGVRDYVGEDGVVTKPGSVAMALMAGCDMDCNGDIYPKHAGKAVEQGLLDEAQINRNVYLSLLSRFRLGEFDPTDAVAYRSADYGFAATVETRDRNTFCTIRGFGPRDVATSRKILVY